MALTATDQRIGTPQAAHAAWPVGGFSAQRRCTGPLASAMSGGARAPPAHQRGRRWEHQQQGGAGRAGRPDPVSPARRAGCSRGADRRGRPDPTRFIRSPRGNYLRLRRRSASSGTRWMGRARSRSWPRRPLSPSSSCCRSTIFDNAQAEGFLTDQPVGIYRALGQTMVERTPEGWGRRILRLLSERRWQIRSIDSIYETIYNTFGWLFFTRVFALIWALVAIAGLGAFICCCAAREPAPAVRGRQLRADRAGGALGGVAGGLPAARERPRASGRALSSRSARRRHYALLRHMPAFFVDTSDIWRSPRQGAHPGFTPALCPTCLAIRN